MGPGLRFAALAVLLAGCQTLLDGPLTRPDAFAPPEDGLPMRGDATLPDGAPPPPPDARVCAGGDASMTDPSTGSCFFIFRAPKTRADAAAACAAANSHLAIIKSAATNAVVQSLALGADTFIGATDAVTEGVYLWPDNTGLVFTNFRAGEPNNGDGQFQEDCLVIQGNNGGTWDDRPCAPTPAGSGVYAYVCQF
jgi:hypothetical protein